MVKIMSQEAIDGWLRGPFDPETKAEILSLQKSDPQKLEEAFDGNLTFGTGGMREIMGVGTHRLNCYTIQMATQGLANYLLTDTSRKHSVFIGFDCRHHSEEFANEAALVLAGNGITVHLCPELRPTPFVSFGVRHLNCSAGIMITASHNTKEYNGYKVYWSDGGQIVAPHDKAIVEEVEKIQMIEQVKRARNPSPLVEIVTPALDEAYLDAIKKCQLDKAEDKKVGDQLKIVYTPLHGTGIKLVPRALHQWGFSNIHLVDRQVVPNGDFPTVKSPNPESKEALSIAISELEGLHADLMIATDPDADRMAVAVRHKGKTHLLNGNQIAAICSEFICHTLKEQGALPANGALVTTIVSTDMIEAIAKHHGVGYTETLTGFKYIGEKIREWEDGSHTFLFGAEESYGFLIGTHCRDKDAVVSSCLVAEIALHLKAEGRTLVDYLNDLYRTYGLFLEGQKTINLPSGKVGMEQMQKMMDQLRSAPPQTLLGEAVTQSIDYQKDKTGLPKSNVILYRAGESSKVVVRPSGTEPKLKIYAAVKSAQLDTKGAEQKLEALMDEFSQLLS